MKNLIVVVLFTFVAVVASAVERSVHIPIVNGEVLLVNSSPVTVYYSVVCVDRVTKVNVVSPSTGLSVPSKESVSIRPGGTGCTNGATASHTTAEGVVFCSKSGTDYASAASLCLGQMCTFQKLNDLGVSHFASGIPMEHWMSTGETGTWSTCNSACDLANTEAPVADGGNSATCYSQAGGAGVAGPACHSHNKTDSSVMGAVCCPTNNGSVTCEVKIESSTSQDGFLQSPNFKSNTPF